MILFTLENVLMSILSSASAKASLPSVKDLLGSPMFSLDQSLPSQPRLKLSSSVKEALKVATVKANERLLEDQQTLRISKKHSKVKKDSEADVATKRKASKKVVTKHLNI